MAKNKTFEEILKENRVLVSIETVKIKDFIFSHVGKHGDEIYAVRI